MAGAIAGAAVESCRVSPVIATVEADTVACFQESFRAGDGRPHRATGSCETIMAGLNCGTPCKTIWPILRDCSAYFCACGDSVTEAGMRAYAKPAGTDPAIVSGESGAVTWGLLLRILQSDRLRELFRIGEDSVILLISTEGATDPEGYARVVR